MDGEIEFEDHGEIYIEEHEDVYVEEHHDIDIEEHDVMDDPRVRQMFPDLAKVKTEFIEDEEVEKYPVDETLDHEINFPLKQEAHEDNYSVFDLTNDDSQLVNNFSNKIIIGSKPSTYDTDDEEVGIRKEYLLAEVVLEDWGEKLRNSTCFCDKCKTLFATEIALDYHKMETHSYLIAITNKAVKSTAKNYMNNAQPYDTDMDEEFIIPDKVVQKSEGKNKRCNHCQKYFPDGTALIKHLYELLTKDEGTNEAKVKQIGAGDSKPTLLPRTESFQCGLCHRMFLGYSGAKVHMAGVHPEVHADDFIVKVVVDNKKLRNEPKMSWNEMSSRGFIQCSADIHYQYSKQMIIKNPPIPRSVLYKCFNCEIHFVMGLPGLHHARQCGNTTPYSICNVCGKKIRSNDVILHKQQHKISVLKEFRIYDCSSNNYKNSLCKCPKCGVCFNEVRFLRHFRECQFIRLDCELCTLCNEYMDENLASAHFNAHSVLKMEKSHFIFVQFLQLTVGLFTQPGKIVKSEMDMGVVRKPIKTLIKCENNTVQKPIKRKIECGEELVGKRVKYGEMKGAWFILNYCKICNSCFHVNRWAAHSNCRRVHRDVCQQCGITFTRKSMTTHMQSHRNKQVTLHDFKFIQRDGSFTTPKVPDYFPCPKCKVRYSTKQLRRFHDCNNPHEVCTICSKKFSPLAHKLHKQFHIYGKNPHKPNNFSEKISVKTKNKTQTHSSGKKYNLLNKMWNVLFYCRYCDLHTDSYDESVRHSHKHLADTVPLNNISHCDVCGLSFDDTSYARHAQLHAKLPINQNDFLILRYDYRTVLTSDWLRLFGKLALKKIQQILSQSVFKETRKVSLEVVKDGLPEHTLLVCRKCNVCVVKNFAPQHTMNECAPVDESTYCQICNIMFDTEKRFKNHTKLHSFINNKFRIVYFDGLKLKSDGWGRLNGLTKMDNDYIFYKCIKCGICLGNVKRLQNHKCLVTSVDIICLKCGVKYRSKYKNRHEKYHLRYPNLSKRNIKFQMFSFKNSKVNLLPTCRCGLGFNTNKEMTRHTELCPKAIKTIKHTVTGNKTSKHTPMVVKSAKHTTVDSKSAKHANNSPKAGGHKKVIVSTKRDDLKMQILTCTHCGMFFKAETKTKKLCSDCDGRGIARESPNSLDTNEHIIYRCNRCSCHYSTIKTWKVHVKCCGMVSRMPGSTCSICGLKFRYRSLDQHVERVHSEPNYSFKVVDPDTGESRIVCS